MTVRAYMLDVAGLEQEANGPEFARLCAALSSRRQKKIEAFRFQSGKALSLGAGLLLDYGLFQYGLREREVAIAYGADEKPYLGIFRRFISTCPIPVRWRWLFLRTGRPAAMWNRSKRRICGWPGVFLRRKR